MFVNYVAVGDRVGDRTNRVLEDFHHLQDDATLSLQRITLLDRKNYTDKKQKRCNRPIKESIRAEKFKILRK